MMDSRARRNFLRAAAAAGATFALPDAIQKALAVPANNRTGTIADVEHVVIFMQENRSFDHYFGMLAGVRGYGDPRAISLPGGKPVWYQPTPAGASYVLPYHFDAQGTNATKVGLNHSWKGSENTWKNWDAWIAKKGAKTMGYFDRGDLPFYYALADAFTICDAYHCSIFGPTDPGRTAPQGAPSRVLDRYVFCSPCFLKVCPYKHECMEEIGVDEALTEARKLLKTG